MFSTLIVRIFLYKIASLRAYFGVYKSITITVIEVIHPRLQGDNDSTKPLGRVRATDYMVLVFEDITLNSFP